MLSKRKEINNLKYYNPHKKQLDFLRERKKAIEEGIRVTENKCIELFKSKTGIKEGTIVKCKLYDDRLIYVTNFSVGHDGMVNGVAGKYLKKDGTPSKRDSYWQSLINLEIVKY